MRISIVLLGILGVAALASATPLACTSNCVVNAASSGYTLPVFDIKAGVPMKWHSTDIGHVQAEGAIGSGGCLGVASFGGQDSAQVVFTIAGGLRASVGGDPSEACTNAQALPDGSYALPYFCEIHSTMRGALIVSP